MADRETAVAAATADWVPSHQAGDMPSPELTRREMDVFGMSRFRHAGRGDVPAPPAAAPAAVDGASEMRFRETQWGSLGARSAEAPVAELPSYIHPRLVTVQNGTDAGSTGQSGMCLGSSGVGRGDPASPVGHNYYGRHPHGMRDHEVSDAVFYTELRHGENSAGECMYAQWDSTGPAHRSRVPNWRIKTCSHIRCRSPRNARAAAGPHAHC